MAMSSKVNSKQIYQLLMAYAPGPILASKGTCAIFQKKGKKGQNIQTFEQKCTKFENILKNDSLS